MSSLSQHLHLSLLFLDKGFLIKKNNNYTFHEILKRNWSPTVNKIPNHEIKTLSNYLIFTLTHCLFATSSNQQIKTSTKQLEYP